MKKFYFALCATFAVLAVASCGTEDGGPNGSGDETSSFALSGIVYGLETNNGLHCIRFNLNSLDDNGLLISEGGTVSTRGYFYDETTMTATVDGDADNSTAEFTFNSSLSEMIVNGIAFNRLFDASNCDWN